MDRDPQVVRRELADAVLGLFDELRREGYAVGVEQYLEAEALLRALADRDEFPDDPHRLGPLLGPIVCKTPMQQEDFCHRFALWVDRLFPCRQTRQRSRSLPRPSASPPSSSSWPGRAAPGFTPRCWASWSGSD